MDGKNPPSNKNSNKKENEPNNYGFDVIVRK